jgi:hypothetical protein
MRMQAQVADWAYERVLDHEARITKLETKLVVAVFLGVMAGTTLGKLAEWLLGFLA